MELPSEAVIVYKTARVDGMYLYVRVRDEISRVPAQLLARFGRPTEALRFDLGADRRLARADAAVVLDALAEHGYYLQLPPTQAELAAQR